MLTNILVMMVRKLINKNLYHRSRKDILKIPQNTLIMFFLNSVYILFIYKTYGVMFNLILNKKINLISFEIF